MKSFAWVAPLLCLSLPFVSGASGASLMCRDKANKCGKLNILFLGLPAYHPDVVRQGFNATQVELGLQSQLLELVSLGYNTKEVFYGPEFGADPVLESLQERKWDGVIVGFGSRGDPTLAGTIHFERTLNAIREKSHKTVFMFNYSPTSTVEAVQRAFPLLGCDDRPGTNYGEHIYCARSTCTTAPDWWFNLS